LNELENLPQTKRTSCTNSRLSITMETTEKWWVNDLDCPYTEDNADWYRGFHVGGKSLMWGTKLPF
jgi:hypothetical protein